VVTRFGDSGSLGKDGRKVSHYSHLRNGNLHDVKWFPRGEEEKGGGVVE